MLQLTPSIRIPDAELIERFVRASGPGGQNVNKVATAVELRFDVANSPCLPEAFRQRVLARRDRRLNDDGVLVILAQRFRTQERNREFFARVNGARSLPSRVFSDRSQALAFVLEARGRLRRPA